VPLVRLFSCVWGGGSNGQLHSPSVLGVNDILVYSWLTFPLFLDSSKMRSYDAAYHVSRRGGVDITSRFAWRASMFLIPQSRLLSILAADIMIWVQRILKNESSILSLSTSNTTITYKKWQQRVLFVMMF